MRGIILFIGMVWNIAWLALAIILVVRFWRLCDVMSELNRTVQFMAYDLKDLRAKISDGKNNPPETETTHG